MYRKNKRIFIVSIKYKNKQKYMTYLHNVQNEVIKFDILFVNSGAGTKELSVNYIGPVHDFNWRFEKN